MGTEMTTPELDRGAAAIAGVFSRYTVGAWQNNEWAVYDGKPPSVFRAETREECLGWISREAARACLMATLPVSDAVVDAMSLCDEMDSTGHVYKHADGDDHFTAAITHITGGE